MHHHSGTELPLSVDWKVSCVILWLGSLPMSNCIFQFLSSWGAKHLLEGMLKMETFFDYLERQPQIQMDGTEKPADMKAEIQFKNVKFSYPSRPNEEVLKVNLHMYSLF